MFCALFAATPRGAPPAAAAAAAAAPAAAMPAAAAPAPATAAPPAAAAAALAADDGRAALCSSQDSAKKVYNFLISTRQRAIDVSMVTTEQDSSADSAVELLEDEQPDSKELLGSARPSKRSSTSKHSKDVGVEGELVDSDSPQKDSPARNFRKPSEDNPFLKKFPPNSGAGMKFGAAVTVATIVIQGPYPKEDKRDSRDHYRFVKSGMLNVCSPSSQRMFDEMADKSENHMYAFCLQRVESARVTIQRSVGQLQKFINTHFGSPAGIAPNWTGRHHAYTFVLKLSTEIVFCGSFLRSPTRPINP